MIIAVFIVKKLISILMSALVVLLSVFGRYSLEPIKPQDPDNLKMSFATISDIHLTTGKFRAMILGCGLKDMEDADYRLDAVCTLGDNTDFGKKEEYENLQSIFSLFDPADNIIMAIGNHDTRSEDDSEIAKEYFKYYSEQITGRHIDNVYYRTEVKGYTFIMIGSEYDGTNGWFTDEQIQWLDTQLGDACGKGKPVFVISHWPINQTHGLPYSFEMDKDAEYYKGGMGLQSDQIKAVLNKYEDVFLLTGHLHCGVITEKWSKLYGWSSFEDVGNIHSINTPSFMYATINGEVMNGSGYVFEVYENKVVVRHRNFIEGSWYSSNVVSYDLNNTK